jgi:oligopeptide/dipeptide ABC transporter ATP-binding protein
VLTIGKQLREPLKIHLRCDTKTANETAANLLTMVGLPDAKQRLKSYPHELSGGMRQRVMIAIALACSPQLLIADEPTTALDVTVQAQIIDIVQNLRDQLGTAMIWITHDLGVIAGLADRVLVMYGGAIVEQAKVADIYQRPEHPYTQGLLNSVPRLDQKGAELESIKGSPPNMYSEPTACTFAPRCPYAFSRCREEVPQLVDVGEDHKVACWWDIDAEAPRNV